MRTQIHDNPIDHGRACSLSHGTWRRVGAKLACAGACALMAGQLLLRSMDRANEVYESMTLRGYQGEFYYTAKESCKAKDWLYLGVWFALFAVLKVTG